MNNPKRVPTHPGAILREDVVPALGGNVTQIAIALGVTRQTLYDIMNEKKSVTAQMAVRLGKLCGNGPGLWIRMQGAHDVAVQSEKMAEEIEKIPTLEALEDA